MYQCKYIMSMIIGQKILPLSSSEIFFSISAPMQKMQPCTVIDSMMMGLWRTINTYQYISTYTTIVIHIYIYIH